MIMRMIIRRKDKIALELLSIFAAAFSAPAFAQPCSSYTYNLSNGTTAYADQVMANFHCAALTSGATFAGTTTFPGATVIDSNGHLGVGMSPSLAIDVTQNQNDASAIRIANNSTGIFGQATVRAYNSSHYAALDMIGTGNTAGGMFAADSMVLESSGTAGIGLNAADPIRFGISGNETARFGSDGNLYVGLTGGGGWRAQILSPGTLNTLFLHNPTTTGTTALGIQVDSTNSQMVAFVYNGTQVGDISTNGSIIIIAGTSDKRLKTDIKDLDPTLARQALAAYHPQDYLLRGKYGVGAVAQDVDARFAKIGIDA